MSYNSTLKNSQQEICYLEAADVQLLVEFITFGWSEFAF